MLPKPTSGAARKRIVMILGTLLAVNAVVAHIVTNQLLARNGGTQVKDDQVIVEEAFEIAPVMDATEGHDDLPVITIYTVQPGDTVSGIAEQFGIRQSTIFWANKLTTKSTLKVGDELVILPIDGVAYTVAKGDTISGIAKKFRVDGDEILSFNDIDDPKKIQPGLELIIPEAKPIEDAAPKKAAPQPAATSSQKTMSAPKSASQDTQSSASGSESKETGGFINPAPGSVLTQGLHAVNAVDLGAPTGTPIRAAAGGTVIVAKGTGAYNGGFGNFIVIAHPNGIKTLYAHLSKVEVTVGENVDQGERIGLMGSTGKSTGPHLHFEIHANGVTNPWAKDKKYTKY